MIREHVTEDLIFDDKTDHYDNVSLHNEEKLFFLVGRENF